MRVKAVISYDGSRFFGFQSQKHTLNTVSHNIVIALKKVGIDSKIVASGRTDRGVHATNQVIHFDLPKHWEDLNKLKNYLNRYLLPSVYFKNLYFVNEDFHARFSAKKRAYRYILSDKAPNPFEYQYITFVKDIDFKKIDKSIKLFEGRYDFKYFMKTGSEVKTTVKTIYKAKFYEFKNYKILYFEADGFLRSQIRMMVDFLLKIGSNRLTSKELKEQLECKNRYSTSLATPNGLYLCRVVY